ncbi:hypothetical protein NM688_g1806 [Phlebia brevispora]|uniref:Uncharacterized protein n=1 Tax=Phlebia brevispora TaxID=194682 RepID=A0ACC1TAK6_9APHY|nr:hypothetical protein NM688_g1806 [Phlebia brevispora]
MPSVAVEANLPDIPPALRTTWTVWVEASQLFEMIKYRQEEFSILLEGYADIIQRAAMYCRREPESAILAVVADIEQACTSMRDVVWNAKERGFLWCLTNAGKLNRQLKACEQSLEKIIHNLDAVTQDNRHRGAVCARDEAQKGLCHIVEHCSNGEQLLQAIRDQEPEDMHRQMPEVLVILRKHVQDHPIEKNQSPLPEDQFIEKAAAIFSQWYRLGENDSFKEFVISSVEVEFDVHYPIGEGAFAKVYEGYWNGTLVAVKQIRSDRAKIASEEQKKAFRHEVITWSNLVHPNILTFYGACLEATVPFLVMDYCPFGHVRNYLQKFPDADRTNLVCKYSMQIASGLAYLHRKNIVHADIKPVNVLVSQDHRARLADFGLALKLHTLNKDSTYSEYMSQGKRGTPLYMAPEIHNGASPNLEADIYSLGLTIWEIYSGELPYQQYLQTGLLADGITARQDRPKRPHSLTEDEVWGVVTECWAPKPEERPTAKHVQVSLSATQNRSARTPHLDPNMLKQGVTSPLTPSLRSIDISTTLELEKQAGSGRARREGNREMASTASASRWNDRTLTPTQSTDFDITVVSPLSPEASQTNTPSLGGNRESFFLEARRMQPAHVSRMKMPSIDEEDIPRHPTSAADPHITQPAPQRPSTHLSSDAPNAAGLSETSPNIPGAEQHRSSTNDQVRQSTKNYDPIHRSVANLDTGGPVKTSAEKHGMLRSTSLPISTTTSFVPVSAIVTPPPTPLCFSERKVPNLTPIPRQLTGELIVYDPSDSSQSPSRDTDIGTIPPQSTASVPASPLPLRAHRPGAVQSRDEALQRRLVEERRKVRQDIDRLLQVTDFRRLFRFDDLEPLLINLGTEVATSRSHGSATYHAQLARLALFKHVIYCDDSTYMAHDNIFNVAKAATGHIANIATRLVSRKYHSTEVRFVNTDIEISGRGEQLQDYMNRVLPRGSNDLGTGLRTRVLRPFVQDAIRAPNKRLERPLLVTVITDCVFHAENWATVKDVIPDCKGGLVAAGYKPTSVLFLFIGINNAQNIQDSLRGIKGDKELKDVLHFADGDLGAVDEENMDDWLLDALTKPIDSLLEKR